MPPLRLASRTCVAPALIRVWRRAPRITKAYYYYYYYYCYYYSCYYYSCYYYSYSYYYYYYYY